jgi:ribosome maturation factor RimP
VALEGRNREHRQEVSSMSDVETTVRALAQPLADAAGVDLVAVQMKGSGSRRLLRVVVGRKGGVDLEQCQHLSKQLSAQLDDADPIPDGYALEVTSPGVDWPLTDVADFDRVEGREVLVHRGTAAAAAPEQVRGTVVSADPDGVTLRVPGAKKGAPAREVNIPYGEIVKARQSLPW